MTIRIPRITDPEDPRQQFLLRATYEEIGDMLFKLTFLNINGATADGTKSYNFDAVWVSYVSNATPDTEDTVPHSLGRIPLGRIVMTADKAGSVFDGATTFTSANLFLQSDVATLTVNLLVF